MVDGNSHIATKASPGAMDRVLPDRGDLALVAVERTRMAMMASDPRLPDNPIVLANQSFLDMCGYTAEEVVGRNCRFLQGPETDPAAIECIRDDIAHDRETTIELLNYRKDGSSFWNQLHISPVRDAAGTVVYHFASQQDVTDRRKAEELQRAELALLREVDHRARNALALVQGIVRLSRADDAGEYATAVQGRVEALAMAHGLLAEGRWRDVPIDRLIAGIVRSLALTSVATSGPAVGLAPDQVQPLALVLHELFDNARRHGALSAPSGKVDIGWTSTGGEIVIRIAEAGGPAPTAKRDHGFGFKMSNAVTTRQLRGRLNFDWRTDGLCTEIGLPLQAAA